MDKRQFRTLVLVTAVAAFAGSALVSGLLSARQAQAAKPPAPKGAAKTVTAQEFLLVDAGGKTQVRIGVNEEGLATVFWTYRGKDQALAGKEQSFTLATMPGFAKKPQTGTEAKPQ